MRANWSRQVRRCAFRALLTTLLLTAGTAWTAPAGAAPPSESPPGDVALRLFSPAWRGIGDPSKAPEVARRFEYIFTNLKPSLFKPHNPAVKVLKYTLGPYVTDKDRDTLLATRPQALARDSQSRLIRATGFAQSLVVPNNPDWLAFLNDKIRNTLMPTKDAFAYDGVFVDSSGNAPVATKFVSAPPVDPATGRLYTRSSWFTALRPLLATSKTAGGGLVVFNGLQRGESYWREPMGESPRSLLDVPGLTGALSETVWRGASDSISYWRPPASWLSEVKMIEDVQARGVNGFFWTKCWSDGNTCNRAPNADTLVPQWRRFALASHLLAAGSKSYFNFDTSKNDTPYSNAAEYFPDYDHATRLGTTPSTNPRQPVAGTDAWFRTFSNGVVLVNPNQTKSVTVALDPSKTYRKFDGATVTGSVTLAPHTGEVLVKNGPDPFPS